MSDGLIVLVCPTGAETGPVSHGATGWEPFAVRHRGRRIWLVAVPTAIHRHFTDHGAGFATAPDELQDRRPPE